MPLQDRPHPRPPIAFIVTAQEWISLSFDTLFSPRGYAVLRAFTSRQALQRVGEFQPDLLVVDKDLRDMTGIEFCRLLRKRGPAWHTTPVMLISNSPWTRDERLEALRAGAWDTCALPMDGEELYLRLDAWVRSKLAGDEIREQGLLDAATGLYNAQGLLRRIIELGAGAVRRRAALACVVIASEPGPSLQLGFAGGNRTVTWTDVIAARLREAGRASDTFGRLSETEFVVVAPDTDVLGVRRLAERLKVTIESASEELGPRPRLRFGCYAVPDFRDASIAPTEMLIRAAEALRGRAVGDDEPIRFFNPPIPLTN